MKKNGLKRRKKDERLKITCCNDIQMRKAGEYIGLVVVFKTTKIRILNRRIHI